VETLTGLKKLFLRDNQITAITGLGTLTHLIHLDLSANCIREMTGLADVTSLEQIYLHNNQISVIQCIESMSSLRVLYLVDNPLPLGLAAKIGALTDYPPRTADGILIGEAYIQRVMQIYIPYMDQDFEHIKLYLSQGYSLTDVSLRFFTKYASADMIAFFIRSPRTHPANLSGLMTGAKQRSIALKSKWNIYR